MEVCIICPSFFLPLEFLLQCHHTNIISKHVTSFMSPGYEYEQSAGYGGYIGDPMGGYGGMDIGGGYMDQKAAMNADSGKKGGKDQHSILPVTTKQVLEAEKGSDDSFMIDNQTVYQVKLLATVISKEEYTTNVNYIVNDGSGNMECKKWIDNNVVEDHQNINEGKLVRIFGQVREYEDKKSILILSIQLCEDWNELTHHLLEVTLNHLQATKGPIPGTQAANKGGLMTPAVGGSYLMFNGGSGLRQPAFGNAATSGYSDDTNEMVFNVYKENNESDYGLSFEAVLDKLQQNGSNMSMQGLKNVVSKLFEDGSLYTTIDDNHYKAID